MAQFFSRLSYSFGNEDWTTELEALQIKPDNRIVCITASGDRIFHLLSQECREIVAVDANPIQNHLLNLKMVAMKSMEYEQYLAFLGVKPANNRAQLLQQLLVKMPPDSHQYWLKNEKLIEKGVIYQGALERWARRVSKLIRLIRRKEINKLFNARDLKEQQYFLEKEWNHTFWKNAFKFGLHPKFTSLFFKDPGTYSNFDSSIQPGLYVYDRMIACLNQNLANENPLISIIFKGEVGEDAYPLYLLPSGINIMNSRLDRITPKTMDIINYLESVPENSFDRFSLSDVASYLDQKSYHRMLKAVHHAAKPGARLCMRQFISRYHIPSDFDSYFKREPDLEKKLEQADRAFVYHFTVGTIIKN